MIVCSTAAKPVFAELAGQPLVAPDHAPGVDLVAATRAQMLVVAASLATAGPDRIAVILDDRHANAQEHISTLNLTQVPTQTLTLE